MYGVTALQRQAVAPNFNAPKPNAPSASNAPTANVPAKPATPKVFASQADLDKAIADFETVVELKNGEAPQALYNLGLIANDEGDTELGDEYLQKAYELDPSLKP